MNDPKGGVAKVTCPTFEAVGQIPVFHRTYFLLHSIFCYIFFLFGFRCYMQQKRNNADKSWRGKSREHWKLKEPSHHWCTDDYLLITPSAFSTCAMFSKRDAQNTLQNWVHVYPSRNSSCKKPSYNREQCKCKSVIREPNQEMVSA